MQRKEYIDKHSRISLMKMNWKYVTQSNFQRAHFIMENVLRFYLLFFPGDWERRKNMQIRFSSLLVYLSTPHYPHTHSHFPLSFAYNLNPSVYTISISSSLLLSNCYGVAVSLKNKIKNNKKKREMMKVLEYIEIYWIKLITKFVVI